MNKKTLIDWSDLDFMANLSANLERLYIRLLFIVDEAGRSQANSTFLLKKLFPISKSINDKILHNDMIELKQAGLIEIYECNGIEFLSVVHYKLMTKASVSRIPPPPLRKDEINKGVVHDAGSQSDVQKSIVEVEKTIEPIKVNTQELQEAPEPEPHGTTTPVPKLAPTPTNVKLFANSVGIPVVFAVEWLKLHQSQNWQGFSENDLRNWRTALRSEWLKRPSQDNPVHAAPSTEGMVSLQFALVDRRLGNFQFITMNESNDHKKP